MIRMKSTSLIFATVFSAFLFSCNNKGKTEQKINTSETISTQEVNKEALIQAGDSIAMHAQKTLLGNVAKAIEKGGTEYAVDFCNIRAIPITDSIAGLYDAQIQRVTNKPRNPINHLATTQDSLIWNRMLTEMQTEKKLPNGVLESENEVYYYYKPISMGMPACIQCHGSKDDIATKTRQIINQKYPNDLAVDYQMKELRGMWKIKMQEQ